MQKLTMKNLLAHSPCADALDFLKESQTLEVAWATCEQADWMIWALSKLNILDEFVAREFACQCAEHTLHFFEDKYPNDKRPREAIAVARRYGADTSSEASAARRAARSAAWSAAESAAWSAAGSAAESAAWSAAESAAESAASDVFKPTKIELQQSAVELVLRMIAANDNRTQSESA